MVRPSAVIAPMTDTARSNARDDAAPRAEPGFTHQSIVRSDISVVVRSKIQAPVLRSTTLSRGRLIDRLRDATQSRLTLLIAEAGYGKTTLLTDFAAQSGQRTLWYRLDSSDADAITWTNYLIAAAREVMPEFGKATESLLAQVPTGSPPDNVIVASLIKELADLGETPTALVLDDFHAVDESASALEFVERLARDAPAWLALVVAARRRPQLRLGRLEAMGEVTHIATDDLRFSLEETAELFREQYREPLEDEVLREVDTRTRGWAASLQLFHGSIRGKSSTAVRTLARSLTGEVSPMYDFLAEEVLGNVPPPIDELLVRASVLKPIVAGRVVALFGDLATPPTLQDAAAWIEEADRLGLLSRVSQTSESRQLHPLLRDFLERRLRQRHTEAEIAAMHHRVAKAVAASDPLTATHHYLEAGEQSEAMRCLGSSVMVTMGSGQWGVASKLIERLQGVPADPAVAAIQARRLIEDGELGQAAELLGSVDESDSPPDVRAVFRHAKLSLGWRTGDRDLMFATLNEIKGDRDTPKILRDIFSIFVDASAIGSDAVPFSALAHRMERMAVEQLKAGHNYYAAISLHNSALTFASAGRFTEAIRTANRALDAFDELPGVDDERYSTHAVIAFCTFEMGDRTQADSHVRQALSSGRERGDVHAECAYALLSVGRRAEASQLMATATHLHQVGRSDVTGEIIATFAEALMVMPTNPELALVRLETVPDVMPLDTGYTLDRLVLMALCHLLNGANEEAATLAAFAEQSAATKGARRSAARLGILLGIANRDADALRAALATAEAIGEMAMLVVADAIGQALWLIPETPQPLRRSIERWPERWLPVIRRQLDEGGTANAIVAASLLDRYGELADISRLGAFAKTYRRQLRMATRVGYSLAQRVSPPLEVRDLGRTILQCGDRRTPLSRVRRKSAALLMFLVTRPGQSATREQVLDELWPESDPGAASNNLNQSLHFLRRHIDPWYEADISAEYVGFQGDVVWLEPGLCRASSAAFAAAARDVLSVRTQIDLAPQILASYSGFFCPEFEYEEWAIAWRSRVHAAFLELVNATIDHFSRQGNLAVARDTALLGLDRDPTATDLERKLIASYWHLGSKSAARTQYEHLIGVERADGLQSEELEELVRDALPNGRE